MQLLRNAIQYVILQSLNTQYSISVIEYNSPILSCLRFNDLNKGREKEEEIIAKLQKHFQAFHLVVHKIFRTVHKFQ